MIRAITGDIIGSIYERHNIKRTDFPFFGEGCTFTDDTVLTVPVADAILNHSDYGEKLKEYFRLFPGRGYSTKKSFGRWSEWWIGRRRENQLELNKVEVENE